MKTALALALSALVALLAGCAVEVESDPAPASTAALEPAPAPELAPAAALDPQPCIDIESGSHPMVCTATLPPWAWTTSTPGLCCFCRPGECPGVWDCHTDTDCSWEQGATCKSGLCQ